MSLVITFEQYEPPDRFDGQPWTQVRIEQAATQSGAFTAIDTQALAPLDANPAAPQARSFTTTQATLAPGWYRVVFLDASGNPSAPSDPLEFAPSPLDNRPSLRDVRYQLYGTPNLAAVPDAVLQRLLDASIAWVEDVCTTSFNGRAADELYDGNTTNALTVRKRPVTSVQTVETQTPILGFTRVYTPDEIKLYVKQGFLKIFTYKLAVEQAMLNTLDYQAWGTIFPPLPQNVHVRYTYGYPQYDPDTNQTTFDGGTTYVAGDKRDPELVNWLINLQQAAVCDAAGSFLAQTAGLGVGVVTGVSFDGYSRQNNPGAYGTQVTALITKRDELLARRRRQFVMATIG